MTEWMRQWLTGITAAALLLSAAEALVRGKGMKRVCRMAGGFVLLLAVLGPVRQIEIPDETLFAGEFTGNAEEVSRQLEKENNDLFLSIIEEKTAAYITDKAEAMGFSCRVHTVYHLTEGGKAVLQEVRLRGAWTEEMQQSLTRVLVEELEVSPEQLYYERTEP